MSLPIGNMEEEKPEEGSRAASLAALVKGFLPKLSLADSPVEPEQAYQKLPVFLPVWLKEKVTKPEARIALRLAAPKIGYESREQILNHLGSYRKFLLRNEDRGKDRATCVARFETNGAWQGMCVKASNGCEWTKACKEASSEDS